MPLKTNFMQISHHQLFPVKLAYLCASATWYSCIWCGHLWLNLLVFLLFVCKWVSARREKEIRNFTPWKFFLWFLESQTKKYFYFCTSTTATFFSFFSLWCFESSRQFLSPKALHEEVFFSVGNFSSLFCYTAKLLSEQ